MKFLSLIESLEKYTRIPRLSFQLESDEYIYMADTMAKINYIFQNIGLIELGKQNLKIYKDDPESIEGIKNNIKYYEGLVKESLNELEENYEKHKLKLNRLAMYEENEDEEERN